MATKYKILPEEQRAFLPGLSGLAEAGFVLYGGTAIALRLGHRESVDFDFFTNRALDRRALVAAAPAIGSAVVLQDEPDTWTLQASPLGTARRPVKVSFFGGLDFGRVGEPEWTDGRELLMASTTDLFGHKLKVLLQRVEAKDYEDIAALLRAGHKIEHGLGAACALFPQNFPPAEALKAMTYFKGGDLKRLSDSDRTVLTGAAARAKLPERLSVLSGDLVPSGPRHGYDRRR